MTIIIERAKLVKGETLEITFSKSEKDKTSTAVTEKHKSKAHPDLVAAYAALAIHLGVMTGYISAKSVKDIKSPEEVDLVDQFTVHSFSLGGEEGGEGVVISGHRKLPNGKAVILNSPFTRFEEDEKTRYQFMDDLDEKLDAAKAEVAEYLGGKVAVETQPELEFTPGATTNNNGEAVTNLQIAENGGKDGSITRQMVDKQMASDVTGLNKKDKQAKAKSKK